VINQKVADLAVARQAGRALILADGGGGHRPFLAVDRAGLEAQLAQQALGAGYLLGRCARLPFYGA
jgi:hypothetical protein